MTQIRCEVCGKQISELKPFSDEKFADLIKKGLLKKHTRLVKIFRPLGPPVEEAGRTWEEAEKVFNEMSGLDACTWFQSWFISRYGKERGHELLTATNLYGIKELVWQCRDCALLDENEYFEKRAESRAKQMGIPDGKWD